MRFTSSRTSDEAEERAWQVVRAAYAEREPVAWPRRHVRPLVAGALVAAVVAAVAEPAGPLGRPLAAQGRRRAAGRAGALLAADAGAAAGDEPRRERGSCTTTARSGCSARYRDAAFSPHGRFVAATRANQLVALDPKGNVRWTLARPGPRFPAWTGTQHGHAHRLPLGRPAAHRGRRRHRRPRGRPCSSGRPGLATRPGSRARVRREPQVRGRDERRQRNDRPATQQLGAGSEARLVERRSLAGVRATRDSRLRPHRSRGGGGRPLRGDLRPRCRLRREDTEAAAIRAAGIGSSVFSLASGRTFFNGSGVLSQLVSSPDGRWLLLAWPTANQWVFVRLHPRKIVGVSRVTQQFGRSATIQGWCCAG